MKWKVNKQNPVESCQFLLFQIFMITVFLTSLFSVINITVNVVETGDNTLIMLTFLYAYGIDLIKQYGTLTIIYYVIVRRCFYLKENEKEFIEPINMEIKYEAAIPNLKVSCLKFLENQYFEAVSLWTIGLYSVFILYDLTISEYLPMP